MLSWVLKSQIWPSFHSPWTLTKGLPSRRQSGSLEGWGYLVIWPDLWNVVNLASGKCQVRWTSWLWSFCKVGCLQLELTVGLSDFTESMRSLIFLPKADFPPSRHRHTGDAHLRLWRMLKGNETSQPLPKRATSEPLGLTNIHLKINFLLPISGEALLGD